LETPKRQFSTQSLVLTLMVGVAVVWLVVPWQDEVAFHFSGQERQNLGDAIGVMKRLPKTSDAYVQVQGILGNKAATVSGLRPGSLRLGPVQVRQLLGASIFVEFDQETYIGRYQMFTQVDVSGRLQDFGPDSELAVAYEYFKDRLKMRMPENAKLLILDEKPGEMWRYPVATLICLLMLLYSIIRLFRRTPVNEVEKTEPMS
jgi:hypothetical protein